MSTSDGALGARRPHRDWTSSTVGFAAAILVGCVGFAGFVLLVGRNPLTAFSAMWNATVIDSVGPGEVLIAAAPIILCGLAVAIPARAGLWNLGGQGQVVCGVLGATGASLVLPDTLPGLIAIPALMIAGAAAGAAWCAISAVLRITVSLNEAISSLLLSYVAVRLLDFAVHGPWKDPTSLGYPQARALPPTHQLPHLGSGRVHLGVLIAALMVPLVAIILTRTRWGFELGVVGGNSEAARRAGINVNRMTLNAMLLGGALGGLAGAIQLAGIEINARPDIAGMVGFLGFLVSWMAGHRPWAILIAGIAIGSVSVGGDALQISADLPAASVNILLALVLLAVLGRASAGQRAGGER